MRLLHARTGRMKEFISEEDLPPYAILSHTWGEEEVKLAQWETLSQTAVISMKGYAKIQHCRDQASRDGLDWVWVDTCCIDKASSAELSEAINSMFRWYKRAEVCYAYLSDVRQTADSSDTARQFCASRWFTRGWTLQELLAPTDVIFYSVDWHRLGTKLGSLLDRIFSITGIDKEYLAGRDLENASVAKRMSWAARRNTSRVEDIAYCLLGIFDLHLPLIYGEGDKAFRRLQIEIMKARPYAHTLFAWGVVLTWPFQSPQPAFSGARELEAAGPNLWSADQAIEPLMGLFAPSPREFADSGHFVPSNKTQEFYWRDAKQATNPSVIEVGVRLELPILPQRTSFVYHWRLPQLAQLRIGQLAILFCCHEDTGCGSVVLPLKGWGQSSFGRTRIIGFSETMVESALYPFRPKQLYIAPERGMELQNGDIVFRRELRHRDPDAVVSRPPSHFLRIQWPPSSWSLQRWLLVLLVPLTGRKGR